jgi:hypothetical protein
MFRLQFIECVLCAYCIDTCYLCDVVEDPYQTPTVIVGRVSKTLGALWGRYYSSRGTTTSCVFSPSCAVFRSGAVGSESLRQIKT